MAREALLLSTGAFTVHLTMGERKREVEEPKSNSHSPCYEYIIKTPLQTLPWFYSLSPSLSLSLHKHF
ncbi:hypothetical protein RIF29_17070 [Crotalaria pallida]|uniref:Uncharacterized protein n=1 Tax=Crotalaria pallida TaxID=3830 RepID=A0AAN9FPV3_CROPI